jgi:hypothetical protein
MPSSWNIKGLACNGIIKMTIYQISACEFCTIVFEQDVRKFGKHFCHIRFVNNARFNA